MLILLSVSVVVRMSFCKASCIFYLVYTYHSVLNQWCLTISFLLRRRNKSFLHKFSSNLVSETSTLTNQKMDLFLYQRLNDLFSWIFYWYWPFRWSHNLSKMSSFNCYAPLNLSQLDNEVLLYSKCKGLVWIFRLGWITTFIPWFLSSWDLPAVNWFYFVRFSP